MVPLPSSRDEQRNRFDWNRFEPDPARNQSRTKLKTKSDRRFPVPTDSCRIFNVETSHREIATYCSSFCRFHRVQFYHFRFPVQKIHRNTSPGPTGSIEFRFPMDLSLCLPENPNFTHTSPRLEKHAQIESEGAQTQIESPIGNCCQVSDMLNEFSQQRRRETLNSNWSTYQKWSLWWCILVSTTTTTVMGRETRWSNKPSINKSSMPSYSFALFFFCQFFVKPQLILKCF